MKEYKVEYGPITVSEQNGMRYLHFGTEWIQGAMRLDKPNELALEYSWKMMAWLLFNKTPKTICQLGLGAASLTKYCYWHLPKSKVVVVELNPDVISTCRSMFCLPEEDDRLRVFQMDAMDFVNDETHSGQFDILSADLYDAEANGPVLDTPEFYTACRQCLSEDGIMAVNLFGDCPSFDKNMEAIQGVFNDVVPITPTEEGNTIVLAFKKRPTIDYDTLKERASVIKDEFGFAARKWAKDVKKAWSLP